MGNTYFQFKQFLINQSKATLKVCTESCIFGAYIPSHNAQNILDIGTGTGILALMLAQRTSAQIQAVELDQPSFEDAQDNFNNSPWKNKLEIELDDINNFTEKTSKRFDLIVCNPPFFIQQLKSPDVRTNSALHGNDLKPVDLFNIVDKLMLASGSFYVLLPESEMKTLVAQFTKANWKVDRYLEIYQKDNGTLFRIVAGFCRSGEPVKTVTEKLVIRKEDNSYTEEFKQLLQPYYLHL